MSRHPQWERRLHELVLKMRDRPYEYGRHDCMTWSADVAKAITGKDHARGHRGKYKSNASAYRYLREKLGHDSPEALLDSLFEEKPVGFAHRGDLVMAADGIPAVCMGAFALSVGRVEFSIDVAAVPDLDHHGLVRVPRRDWVKAWRVG